MIQQYIAQKLCKAACSTDFCPICERYNQPCSMWYTFMNEADVVLKAVRDYYMLTPRKKPRI